MKDAEAALTGGAGLPQELLEAHAKEILLKKQLFHDQVAALKATQLKTLAKETKVKHWQWSNKDELMTLFTETDPAKAPTTPKPAPAPNPRSLHQEGERV